MSLELLSKFSNISSISRLSKFSLEWHISEISVEAESLLGIRLALFISYSCFCISQNNLLHKKEVNLHLPLLGS